MPEILVSFRKQEILFGGKPLFRRRERMRFEWIALLAFKRATFPPDQSSVSLEEVARLPGWSGKARKHIGDNVSRYLASRELSRGELIAPATAWAGPYRLTVDAPSIHFDVSVPEVRKRLRLHLPELLSTKRPELLRFTFSFARAQSLFFQGRLKRRRGKSSMDNAYDRLTTLAEDESYTPTLRLLARLAEADIHYRRGWIHAARQLLVDNADLIRKTQDLSVRAQYYLRLAWAHQRSSTGLQSDREVKKALNRATGYAENSGDRAALAHLAFRWGAFLTKAGHHYEAIDQMCFALEGYLITGNYDGVQSACGNIGSVVHRLGIKHYAEARSWLVLSVAIARWMKIGRDDAHGEMILGKIYVERNKKEMARLWLRRAERIARLAAGHINLADTKMVWGFYYRQFGKRRQMVHTLAEAVLLFQSLTEFDVAQKTRYMERCFSEVWSEVLDRCRELTGK